MIPEGLTVKMLYWSNQDAEEAIQFHRSKKTISESRLQDFRAGYLEGYMKALHTLDLHGFIKSL